MKRTWIVLIVLSLVVLACSFSSPRIAAPTPADTQAAPSAGSPTRLFGSGGYTPVPSGSISADTHPRLWLTPASVPYYRAWAGANNPIWESGIKPLAERARTDMDQGNVPGKDCGSAGYEDYPTETYAEFFAFLSQIDPDEKSRADAARRARTLLMHVMDKAAKGPALAQNVSCDGSQQYPPFRNPDFFTTDRDRARYHGEAYALTVDWIYPSLSAQDKATIRKVFLRWSQDIVTRGYHHPEPVGVINDPRLLQDQQQVRFSGNNYFTAHMRNLGLMAMALDPKDDPGGQLHQYLDTATGAYLYIFNDFIKKDARGGVLPEGMEYSPQTASYVAEFLWAMQTAQVSNAGQYVDQAFWKDFITAYFHSISPVPALVNVGGDTMSVYQPSWYGDSVSYTLPDFIDSLTPLAHIWNDAGQTTALRWIAVNTAPGGADRLIDRVANPDDFRKSLLYFMLLDPNAGAPADPRPTLPLDDFAPGLTRIFSRTGWDAAARWFTYRLGWNSIDHQMADGNHFEFYRKGEWLTKGRAGYADIAEGIASSEFYNTVAIENDRPNQDPSDWRMDLWKRGSQWNLISSGDPRLVASSFNAAFTYATGDATPLYNSEHEAVTDVTHASRSILWLKPDDIIVYDRAETKTSGRFKRWWLQLAQPAAVDGNQAAARTTGGQQLFVTALLPAGARLQAVNTVEQHIRDTTAANETMSARLMTEAPGSPQAARFLHILQGADAGAARDPVALVRSEDGAWEGALVHGTVVLFAHSLPAAAPQTLAYSVPAGVTLNIITGLPSGASFNVQKSNSGSRVVITPGAQLQADPGGVLVFK